MNELEVAMKATQMTQLGSWRGVCTIKEDFPSMILKLKGFNI